MWYSTPPFMGRMSKDLCTCFKLTTSVLRREGQLQGLRLSVFLHVACDSLRCPGKASSNAVHSVLTDRVRVAWGDLPVPPGAHLSSQAFPRIREGLSGLPGVLRNQKARA